MPYDTQLADRVRNYLAEMAQLKIEEKEMFSGLAFMVNDKMCINVSGDELMCRFDPNLTEEVAEKPGFRSMVMKGKEMKGYGYVDAVGFRSQQDFEYWIKLCLDFNERAKSSKTKK